MFVKSAVINASLVVCEVCDQCKLRSKFPSRFPARRGLSLPRRERPLLDEADSSRELSG